MTIFWNTVPKSVRAWFRYICLGLLNSGMQRFWSTVPKLGRAWFRYICLGLLNSDMHRFWDTVPKYVRAWFRYMCLGLLNSDMHRFGKTVPTMGQSGTELNQQPSWFVTEIWIPGLIPCFGIIYFWLLLFCFLAWFQCFGDPLPYCRNIDVCLPHVVIPGFLCSSEDQPGYCCFFIPVLIPKRQKYGRGVDA